jgi:hypothetical protein
VDWGYANFLEFTSVLKNSSMPPWSPDQGLKDPLSAVFWPWFGGVGFVFDLPTGQMATFSTRCYLPRTPVNKGKKQGWGAMSQPSLSTSSFVRN